MLGQAPVVFLFYKDCFAKAKYKNKDPIACSIAPTLATYFKISILF